MSTLKPFFDGTETLPNGVTKDHYCSPRVTLETCNAIFIQLVPISDLRCFYMFWKDDIERTRVASRTRQRIRDLRPGDLISIEGFQRQIETFTIYR